MEKEGKTWVIVLVVIVALIIVGLAIYLLIGSGGSNNTTTPPTDIYASHCKITSATNTFSLTNGMSSSLPKISGYQGTLDQVTWSSSNPNVAAVNPVSGPDAMLQGIAPGTATITATDTAVGPKCTASIQVTVQ